MRSSKITHRWRNLSADCTNSIGEEQICSNSIDRHMAANRAAIGPQVAATKAARAVLKLNYATVGCLRDGVGAPDGIKLAYQCWP
jgi:hypothetical protein